MKTIVVLFALIAGAASAADAPIDFTQALVSPITGKAFVQPGPDCKPNEIAGKDCSEADVTLGDAAMTALETVTEQDRNTDAKTKFERDQLARKVYRNKSAVLSVDEIKIIKDRIGLVWTPAVIGVTWRMLDPSLREAGK